MPGRLREDDRLAFLDLGLLGRAVRLDGGEQPALEYAEDLVAAGMALPVVGVERGVVGEVEDHQQVVVLRVLELPEGPRDAPRAAAVAVGDQAVVQPERGEGHRIRPSADFACSAMPEYEL